MCVFVCFFREGLKFLMIRELMQKGEEQKQHHEESRMNTTLIKSMSFSKSIFHFLKIHCHGIHHDHFHAHDSFIEDNKRSELGGVV